MKTRPRDYGKAQRCAVAIYTARQRLKAIEAAGARGVRDNGASAIERQREADVLAILSVQAGKLNAQFFRDFGDALGVLLREGADAFRHPSDEPAFVARCAHAGFRREFARALAKKHFGTGDLLKMSTAQHRRFDAWKDSRAALPTLDQFRDFLMRCADDPKWPEARRQRAKALSTHTQLFTAERKICAGLRFAPSKTTRGKSKHGG